MTDLRKHILIVVLLLALSGANSPLLLIQKASRVEAEQEQGTGENKTIHVIGRGAIYSDNVARARDNAIADALQAVAEEATGLLLSPSSVMQDFQLLSDRVYNQTQTFIHDYKVLTESKSGRYYRVLVRATVSMNAVQQKLGSVGILTMHKGTPAVMFFLSEQNIGESSPRYWWGQTPLGKDLSVAEMAISKHMRKKGFVMVDRGALGRDVELGPEYVDPELSDDAAAKLGRELGADLVIVGYAMAGYSGNASNSDVKSIQATVSTRAIYANSGIAVASSQRIERVVPQDERSGSTEALTLAASAVAQDLTRQIVAKWGEDVRRAALVELVVQGIKEYADFIRFRKHLRNDIRGVRSVYLRGISAGEAKLDVDVIGDARALADDLSLQPFENFSVNIVEVSEKAVRLELISDQPTDS